MSPILPDKIKRSKSGTKYLPAVDLHDHSFKDAKNVVITTIQESHSTGISRIRFITGKGNHVNSNGDQGVLFKSFRSWLTENEIKHLVKSCIQYDGSYVVTLQRSKKLKRESTFLDENINLIQQEASSNNDADAQFVLGLMYLDGTKNSQKDINKALKWLKKSAGQGDINSQILLGTLFYEGKGVGKNLKEAFKWFILAAEKGNSDAQFTVGRMYLEGEGVKKDIEEALKWFKLSANQGDINAQLFAGNLLYEGKDINKNQKEALKLYKQAAKQDNVLAQIMVSKMYSSGEGIWRKNHKKAYKWIKKAAQQDNSEAQFILGKMYARGQGPKQRDVDEALIWFKKAADQGHFESGIIVEAFTI